MAIYLLKPVKPWKPWWDKCFGMIIRAESEAEARSIANGNGGDEESPERKPWLDCEKTSCEIVSTEGESLLILKDMRNA